MSQAEKTDFNTSVANLNAEIKDVVDQNGYQAFSGAQSVIDANDYPNPDKDDVNTNTINNPPVNNLDDSSSSDPSHVPYDMDGDGYFETIVFLDANGNIETIAIDTDGSGSTETRIESDGTIIGILPADESDWEEEESEYDVEEEPFIDIYDVMEENTPPADSYTDYNQFISDDFNPNADISEFIWGNAFILCKPRYLRTNSLSTKLYLVSLPNPPKLSNHYAAKSDRFFFHNLRKLRKKTPI